MASFARKAIQAGVQFVGGCCGTTPNHIRAMRSAMRAIDAQARVTANGAAPILSTETPPAPLGARSRIGTLIQENRFVTLVEIVPPRGIDCAKEIEGARLLAQLGVHAINVPDSPRASARMSAQSLCIQIQQHTALKRFCITPAATAICSPSNRICLELPPSACTISCASPAIRPSWATIRTLLPCLTWMHRSGQHRTPPQLRSRHRQQHHRRLHQLHHRRCRQSRRARYRE